MTWKIGKQRLKTAAITAHFVIEEVMGEEDLERVVVMTDEPMSPSVFSSRTASATITSGDLEAARETNLNPPCWPVLRASHTSP